MNCETCINLMDDFVDSALSIDERQRMEGHLQTCRNCREELRSLQSLLNHCIATGETPNRDLWPEIKAGIITASQKGETVRHRYAPWTWRLAAVAIIGTMLLLAAAYLWHRPTAQVSKTEEEVINMPGVLPTPTSSDPRSSQDLSSQAAEPRGSEIGASTANYEEACQCAPSSKISDLIDKAWVVDPDIPYQSRRENISNRLYNLATVNGDNFFLHRASIEEDPRFSTPVTDDVMQRYGLKLAQHPKDPVWTYLYASSLLGKNTPLMIRTMEQLIAEHPEFPWPSLVLAQIYGLFDYKDETKARSNLQTFMRMCPESPEPTKVLVPFSNSEFLKNATRRMRANLAKSSDLPSLLLYQNLWYLEVEKGATGEEFSNIQQRIREDLKRLQSLDFSWRQPIAQVIIASGYSQIGDDEIARNLNEKDTSYGGRWATVMRELREWNEKNPVPAQNAPAEKQAAYWESRLLISDSWIKKLPDNPSFLILKIEALAALNRPESEFLDLSAKVLALQRAGAMSSEPGHLPWRSNILKLASLCADRGISLNQLPALIEEGYAAAENVNRENLTDFSQNPQWVLLMGKFNAWVEADNAWHKLAATYLRLGKQDKANEALAHIEPRLREFKMLLAQAQANAKPDDSKIMASQRQSISDQLSNLEKKYASARASTRSALRR